MQLRGLKSVARYFLRCALGGVLTLSAVVGAAEPPSPLPMGPPPIPRPPIDLEPLSEAELRDPPAESWLMFRGNHASWGHSPLNTINKDNVADLQLAWAVGMEAGGSNQATPLVHDGVLFLPHAGDVITAHSATSGDLLWEYRHKRIAEAWGSGEITRNIALFGDKIFHATADARVIALDATTGALVWDASVGDPALITHSSGPIVAGGRVFTGRVCRYNPPARCFIAAHDASTGEELWRTHVIPGPGEPGDESWAGLPYEERAHGSVWLVGSYDAELDTLYWGTSGPAPSPEVMRGGHAGDMLYTNSTLAMDPATGAIKWHVQHLPRDNWDVDHTYERILVDANVEPTSGDVRWIRDDLPKGQQKLLTGIPGKPGIVWTMDRRTGEFLWAKETLFQNVVADIDTSSGRVEVNEEVIFEAVEGEPKYVCPSLAGGRDWPAGAYDPGSKTLFMPMFNICMNVTASAKDPRYGLKPMLVVGPDSENVGRLEAINVETGRTQWIVENPYGLMSVLSTGGGLVFAGDTQRRFRAYDQTTGDVMWEKILGGPVSGFPISYAVNGKQYVAVAVGGGSGAINGWTFLSRDSSTRQAGNTLFVFALPDSTTVATR